MFTPVTIQFVYMNYTVEIKDLINFVKACNNYNNNKISMRELLQELNISIHHHRKAEYVLRRAFLENSEYYFDDKKQIYFMKSIIANTPDNIIFSVIPRYY